MVIQANVCAVGKVQEGVSARTGNPWRKQEFVIEWFVNPNDTQSQKIVLSIMNERIEQFNMQVGDKVEARFDLRYREYEGRFYQDVFMPLDGLKKINKVNHSVSSLQPQQLAQQAAQGANGQQTGNNQAGAPFTPPQQQGAAEEHDDLPF